MSSLPVFLPVSAGRLAFCPCAPRRPGLPGDDRGTASRRVSQHVPRAAARENAALSALAPGTRKIHQQFTGRIRRAANWVAT
jgi:hypothetical protein